MTKKCNPIDVDDELALEICRRRLKQDLAIMVEQGRDDASEEETQEIISAYQRVLKDYTPPK
jgi:hypothetical protein